MSAKKSTSNQRTFISPGNRNLRILAKAGTLVSAAPNSFSGGLPIDLRRDGDVWVEFHECAITTEDPEVIAWCEANDGSPILDEDGKPTGEYEPDICKDITDPQVRAWVALKNQTIPSEQREATLPQDTDVGKILRGEADTLGKDSLVDQLQGR